MLSVSSSEKGSFRKVHFLEILENLEMPENSKTVENKGESDHFLRDFGDSRDSSIEKTPFAMTPFSGPNGSWKNCSGSPGFWFWFRSWAFLPTGSQKRCFSQKRCLCPLPKRGVQETVLLVNHALAHGTPAIFVVFVVSRGSSSKPLVLLVRMQIRHLRHFRQNPPLFFFWQDKSTVHQKHCFRDPEKRGGFDENGENDDFDTHGDNDEFAFSDP